MNPSSCSSILFVSNCRGRILDLCKLAKKNGASAVVHCGDFGLYDLASFDTLSEETLKSIIQSSSQFDDNATKIIGLEGDEFRAALKDPAVAYRISDMVAALDESRQQRPHSSSEDPTPNASSSAFSMDTVSTASSLCFPLDNNSKLKVSIPIFVVRGPKDDVRVSSKFIDGVYSLPNIHVIGDSPKVLELNADFTSQSHQPRSVKLFCLGGDISDNALFEFSGDDGQKLCSDSVALRIGRLAADAVDDDDVRIVVASLSPLDHPILSQFACSINASFIATPGLDGVSTSVFSFASLGLDQYLRFRCEENERSFCERLSTVLNQSNFNAEETSLVTSAERVWKFVPATDTGLTYFGLADLSHGCIALHRSEAKGTEDTNGLYFTATSNSFDGIDVGHEVDDFEIGYGFGNMHIVDADEVTQDSAIVPTSLSRATDLDMTDAEDGRGVAVKGGSVATIASSSPSSHEYTDGEKKHESHSATPPSTVVAMLSAAAAEAAAAEQRWDSGRTEFVLSSSCVSTPPFWEDAKPIVVPPGLVKEQCSGDASSGETGLLAQLSSQSQPQQQLSSDGFERHSSTSGGGGVPALTPAVSQRIVHAWESAIAVTDEQVRSGSSFDDDASISSSDDEDLSEPIPGVATIWVGNLPDISTEADLRAYFRNIQVLKIKLSTRRPDKRPFAYVDVRDEDMDKALRLSGERLHGARLKLEYDPSRLQKLRKKSSVGSDLVDATTKSMVPDWGAKRSGAGSDVSHTLRKWNSTPNLESNAGSTGRQLQRGLSPSSSPMPWGAKSADGNPGRATGAAAALPWGVDPGHGRQPAQNLPRQQLTSVRSMGNLVGEVNSSTTLSTAAPAGWSTAPPIATSWDSPPRRPARFSTGAEWEKPSGDSAAAKPVWNNTLPIPMQQQQQQQQQTISATDNAHQLQHVHSAVLQQQNQQGTIAGTAPAMWGGDHRAGLSQSQHYQQQPQQQPPQHQNPNIRNYSSSSIDMFASGGGPQERGNLISSASVGGRIPTTSSSSTVSSSSTASSSARMNNDDFSPQQQQQQQQQQGTWTGGANGSVSSGWVGTKTSRMMMMHHSQPMPPSLPQPPPPQHHQQLWDGPSGCGRESGWLGTGTGAIVPQSVGHLHHLQQQQQQQQQQQNQANMKEWSGSAFGHGTWSRGGAPVGVIPPPSQHHARPSAPSSNGPWNSFGQEFMGQQNFSSSLMNAASSSSSLPPGAGTLSAAVGLRRKQTMPNLSTVGPPIRNGAWDNNGEISPSAWSAAGANSVFMPMLSGAESVVWADRTGAWGGAPGVGPAGGLGVGGNGAKMDLHLAHHQPQFMARNSGWNGGGGGVGAARGSGARPGGAVSGGLSVPAHRSLVDNHIWE